MKRRRRRLSQETVYSCMIVSNLSPGGGDGGAHVDAQRPTIYNIIFKL